MTGLTETELMDETTLSASVTPVVSAAQVHNGVPLVRRVEITHHGPERPGAQVHLELRDEQGSLSQECVHLVDLPEAGSTVLDEVALRIDAAVAFQVEDRRPGTVSVRLEHEGITLAEQHTPVTVLAGRQWLADPPGLGLELLAAHVMPNSPEVAEVVGRASDLLARDTESGSIQGYQAGPERVDQIVAAILSALAERQVRYAVPPASWGDVGQKVRTPAEVLEHRAGTCLDTVVLMAAALEQAGIRPLLWLLHGHAFLGYWREEMSLDAIVTTEVPPLLNTIQLGAMRLVETTLITGRDSEPPSLARAHSAAMEQLSTLDEVIGVVDVHSARRNQLFPLPARTRAATGEIQVVEYRPAVHSSPAPHIPGRAGTRTLPNAAPAPPRVEQWKNALLDLSLRNRLINFTPRYAVSLTVPSGRIGDVEDLLHQGRTPTLMPGDALDAVHQARGLRTAADLPAEQLAEELDRRRPQIYTDLTSAGYASRLRNLAYSARTVLEETGANNLYLALGSMVWSLDGRELRSPLILVPVHLRARGRGERTAYRVHLDETGASTPNYCLLEKLRHTHGLSLPELAEPAEDAAGGIDLPQVLQAVRVALLEKGLPFHVEETAHLAILQFAKFRLWKDLAEGWETLLTNPLAAHLANSPTEPFVDPVDPPGPVDLDELAAQCPIAADASQLTAIAEAVHGNTFVLEGPPGTGKSQTITNLLARATAEGRSVLFVAEKRAALDVVKSRLDAIGLGPLSLDLHDRNSRPVAVRGQISRALDHQAAVDREGVRATGERLRAATRTLDRYARRLHQDNGAGLSLYAAHTATLALADVTPLPVPATLLEATGKEPLTRVRDLLRVLPEVSDPARPHPQHPWGFVRLDSTGVDPAPVLEAVRAAEQAATSLPTTGLLGNCLRLARTPSQLRMLVEILVDRPDLDAQTLALARTPRWRDSARTLQQEVAAFAEAPHPGMDQARPEVLDLPLEQIHAAAELAATSSWWGRGRRLREVGERLRPGLAAGVQLRARQVPILTGVLVQVQQRVRELRSAAQDVPGVRLPEWWNPLRPAGSAQATPDPGRDTGSDLAGASALGAAVDQVSRLATTLDPDRPGPEGAFAQAVTELLAGARRPEASHLEALGALCTAVDRLTTRCAADEEAWATWAGTSGLVATLLRTREGRDTGSVGGTGTLRRWLALRAHLRPLLDVGMDAAHAQLLVSEVDADDAVRCLDRGLAEASLVERRLEGGLETFDGQAHQRSIDRFNRSAVELRDLLVDAVPDAVVRRRPFSGAAGMGRIGELRRELARRRGGMRVRELLHHYGDLITRAMPCVLVSPDSLARFFPVSRDLFDIVVFDEASQIRVADAIGALGRARSVVVVGDSRQMPPTSVAETTSVRTEEDDDALGGVQMAVEDEESILSECVQARVRQHWLSWHYRSQDESLIAFSNQHYYEGRLSSFPSPTSGAADPRVDGHGINLVRLDGTFHRSGGRRLLRTNPVEARAIVGDVARRFQAHQGQGHPSIGIVTFNQQQRAYIETLVRDHEDPRLAQALDGDEEGLFVKNLENVQGDERDVILFSTAFSVNQRGVLPLNFGPLNQGGGERRLNVAITRARRQVVVYSSFDPHQLRAEETTSLGIQHLRAYLELASAGTVALEKARRRSGERDRHRDQVAAALEQRGLVVEVDVGLSDFRVDLAVSLPDRPDRRVMAVILDGPGWAARRTVGDRDGLPVLVLGEVLRWPVVARVWLPSWLADREEVLDALVALADGAPPAAATEPPQPAATPAGAPEAGPKAEQREPPANDGQDEPSAILASETPPAEATYSASGEENTAHTARPGEEHRIILPGETPWRPWTTEQRGSIAVLDGLPNRRQARQVERVLLEVARQEGPVHESRLARQVAAAFTLTKVSRKRERSILDCLPAASRCVDDPEFVWVEGDYRNWSGFRRSETYERPVDQIARRELGNALQALCRAAAGVEREELLRQTLSIFGGSRLTPGIRSRLEDALTWAESNGMVRLGPRGVYLAGDDPA